MWVDRRGGACRDAHTVEVAVVGEAVVAVMILVREDLVVVRLAAAPTSRAARNTRVDDHIVVAGLVVAHVCGVQPTTRIQRN
eukprot:SAG31_NODE_6286_length_2084_cov_1.593451_1_plen_82_part_00